MSKNNTIVKSDKKFIRREKARIRAQFFDLAKQEEKITELYSRFIKNPAVKTEVKAEKKEVKKEEPKAKKVTKAKAPKNNEKKLNKA